MEIFDTNGDNKIKEEEFMTTMKLLADEHNYEMTEEDIENAKAEFKKADTDQSGDVDIEELRKTLDSMF